MNVKVFDRELYNKYNDFAIVVATKFLGQCGYEFVNKKECYKSHDFIVSKNGHQYKIEVEVSQRWTTIGFPFDSMTVPFRKAESKADFYIQMNKSGTALFFMPMKNVLKASIITKNTCYTRNEMFFNLPVSALKLYYLEDDIYYEDSDEEDPISVLASV